MNIVVNGLDIRRRSLRNLNTKYCASIDYDIFGLHILKQKYPEKFDFFKGNIEYYCKNLIVNYTIDEIYRELDFLFDKSYLIVLPFSMTTLKDNTNHSNFIIINNYNKVIIRFEPNDINYLKDEMSFEEIRFEDILKKKYGEYTSITISLDITKNINKYSKNDDGYCMIVNLIYLEYLLKNDINIVSPKEEYIIDLHCINLMFYMYEIPLIENEELFNKSKYNYIKQYSEYIGEELRRILLQHKDRLLEINNCLEIIYKSDINNELLINRFIYLLVSNKL